MIVTCWPYGPYEPEDLDVDFGYDEDPYDTDYYDGYIVDDDDDYHYDDVNEDNYYWED